MLSTGQQCVGYNFGYDVTGNNPQRSKFVAYSSSYVCTGFYHPMDGFLYLWASWNTLQSSWTPTVPTATQPLYGVPVLVCVDVRNLTGPPKSCPTPHYYMSGVILDLGSAPTLFSINHAVWMPSVNRYYMLEAQSKVCIHFLV